MFLLLCWQKSGKEPFNAALLLFVGKVTCVVNNFQSPVSSAKEVSPPENLPSVPVLGLPCVDSSLNKLSVAQVRDIPDALLHVSSSSSIFSLIKNTYPHIHMHG